MSMGDMKICKDIMIYDNGSFYDDLKAAGVNVSYSSRNTESIFTSTIVPNLMNLSYVASDDGYSIDNIALTEKCIITKIVSK